MSYDFQDSSPIRWTNVGGWQEEGSECWLSRHDLEIWGMLFSDEALGHGGNSRMGGHAHLSLPSSPEACYKIVIPELSSKYQKSSGIREYAGILIKYVSRGSLWLVCL